MISKINTDFTLKAKELNVDKEIIIYEVRRTDTNNVVGNLTLNYVSNLELTFETANITITKKNGINTEKQVMEKK